MSFRGLTSNEVAGRVAGGQSNAWQPRVGRSYLDILRDNLFNVFNLVLFPLLGVIVHFREYAVAIFAGFSVISNAVPIAWWRYRSAMYASTATAR